METIAVYSDRRRLFLLLIASFGFVLLCFALLHLHQDERSLTAAIAIYAGTPFFALCGLLMLFRLVRRKPAIIIDKDGFTDQASAAAVGFIPWSDITDAKITFMKVRRSQLKFLGISLRNPDVYLAKCKPMVRMLLRANGSLSGYFVNIAQVSVSMELETMLAHIDAHIRQQADRSGTVEAIDRTV